MSTYTLAGKNAIVTGGGSGICHALCAKLLASGVNIVVADLSLRPEVKELYTKYPHPAKEGSVSAVFVETDMGNWSSIKAMWDIAIKTYSQVDIVVNGAGIYEPPSSNFWEFTGVTDLAEDDADASIGQYKTFGVNTIGSIRLAQIAVDYWLRNREVQGNLLWFASLGAYVHSFQSPMYYASKAAIVSMVRSLHVLKKDFGIRNSAICPGVVNTPIFHPDYCKDRIRPGDLVMTPDQCAEVAMSLLTEPQYGDGNVVEAMLVGKRGEAKVNIREVPLEALYPAGDVVSENNHVLEEEQKFLKQLKDTWRP